VVVSFLGLCLLPWLLGFIALGVATPFMGDTLWVFLPVTAAVAGGYAISFRLVTS
jgi:hypothetical protein